MRLKTFLGHAARAFGLVVAIGALVPACDDPQEPPIPTSLTIFSGNNQYSKKGTQLGTPLTVTAHYADGSPAQRFYVDFTVIAGGGTVVDPADATDDAGQASTRLILGPATGTNRVQAVLRENRDLSVVFTATSSDFFCPEEDPAFARKFANAGDLFLFTRHSRHNEINNLPVAGIVRITPQFTPAPAYAITRSVIEMDEEGLLNTPKDCAFGRTGDFFMARSQVFSESIKLEPDFTWGQFSPLEGLTGSEFDTSPGAILVGCDEYGPFALGCRDTLTRFDEALYSGTSSDRCSDDAFAADQVTQDLYFIYLGDNTLRRLPVDSLVSEGPVEIVTGLSQDEAEGANGMVVADNGDVFILVDTQTTKSILRVTSTGTTTTEFDFTSRGAGTLAGVQRDLAIWRVGLGVLFTIDTENDVLLAYDVTQQVLTELAPHPTQSIPEALSLSGSSGERIGLAVLP